MEVYGGKNAQKRREETREKVLREKVSFIKTFFVILSIVPLFGCAGYQIYKYLKVMKWNESVLANTKNVWSSMDVLEKDILNSVLFLKGCRKNIVFQETANGFQLQTVESRSNSMEILRDVPVYAPDALSAYLGTGIKTGDRLIYCNKNEERPMVLKTIRSNPKVGYHYLLFDQVIDIPNDVQSNLIKFTPIEYVWEKVGEGNERLIRKENNKEKELLNNIHSHEMKYSFADSNQAYFAVDLTMNDAFPDGQPIRYQRVIPLTSFQVMPPALEGKIP